MTLVSVRKRSVSEFQCLACSAKSSDWLRVCPQCGASDTLEPLGDEGEETWSNDRQVPSHRKAIAADLITEKVLPTISTGRSAWDTALGGGLTRPSSLLVRGPAGVGKSTSLLGIACHVAKMTGGVALYGSAEMPATHLRDLANKLGISRADLRRLYIQDSPEAEDLLADIDELEPVIVIWDSMQRFRWEGALGQTELRQVVTSAIDAGASVGAVTILISQVTKDDDFVGENGIRHDVDVELELRKAGAGLVGVDCNEKNRFAPTPLGGIEELRAPKENATRG